MDTIELEGIFIRGYGFIAKVPMEDRRISLSAKGVYSYLCSFSGKGKDAFPSRKRMCYDLVISNDTLGKYLKELKDYGYIIATQEKKSGKFANNVYKINLNAPIPKNTDTEIFGYGELDTNNNNVNNNNNNNNKNINNNVEKISKPTKKELLTMEQFGELWNMYPRKDGKKKSFDYINKSIKDGATIEQIKNGILGYVKDIKEKGTEPKYIKMGSTFFNQECWRDYEPIQDKEKQEFKLENEEQKETESFDNTLINGFLK